MDRRTLLTLAGASGLAGFSPLRREECRRDGVFPDGVTWYAVWQPGSPAAPPTFEWPEGFPATPDTIYYSYRKTVLDEGWLKLDIVGAYNRFLDGRTEVSLLNIDARRNPNSADLPAPVRSSMRSSSNGRPNIDVRYTFNVGARELRSRFPIELQTNPRINPQQVDRELQEAAKLLAIDYWAGSPLRVRVATRDGAVLRDFTVPTVDFSPDRLASQFRSLIAESRTRTCTNY